MNEIAGQGNWYTAEFWEYNTRIAGRANPDPVKMSRLSPYAVFGGNPIRNVDPNGALFFGMFGSTSEQRQSARNFASQHGGQVQNLLSKSVHVDYTKGYFWNEGDDENGGYTADKGTQYFHSDGSEVNQAGEITAAGPPSLMQRWSQSSFLLSRATYSLADAFYVSGQNLGGNQLTLSTNTFHLNGELSTGNDNVDAFVTSGTSLVPIGGVEGLAGRTIIQETGEAEVKSLVQLNRTAGNAFRDDLANALRAEGRTVNTEVYKATPFGKRYIDLDVWHNGVNLGGIETKVGLSRYNTLQRLKDLWLERVQDYPVNLVRKPTNW